MASYIPLYESIAISKSELINEIVDLCWKEGLYPDEKKLRKRLMAAPTADIERLLDAFYRFGVRNILEYSKKRRNEIKGEISISTLQIMTPQTKTIIYPKKKPLYSGTGSRLQSRSLHAGPPSV